MNLHDSNIYFSINSRLSATHLTPKKSFLSKGREMERTRMREKKGEKNCDDEFSSENTTKCVSKKKNLLKWKN